MSKPTREDAIQAILTEVHKGYTIDEAVKRLTASPPKKQSEKGQQR